MFIGGNLLVWTTALHTAMGDPHGGPEAVGGAGTEVGVRAAKRLRVDKQLFDDATVPEVAVREVMWRVVQQVRDIGVSPSCRFFPDRVEEAQFRFERDGHGGGKVVWTCVACSKFVATTGTSALSMQGIKRWQSRPAPPLWHDGCQRSVAEV